MMPGIIFGRFYKFFLLALFVLQSKMLMAHERWVNHSVKAPIHDSIFENLINESWETFLRPGGFLLLMAILWLFRIRIADFLKSNTSAKLKPVINYIFGTEVKELLSPAQQRFILTLAIRMPALVLIFAAAESCLLMPSFPLHGPSNVFFRSLQTVLAVMILVDLYLPVVGLLIAAAVGYCFVHFGYKIGIDGLPFIAVTFLYMCAPLKGGSQSMKITSRQIQILQGLFGVSFFLLGIMKLVNYELTIGVADNYPNLMNNPMLSFLMSNIDKEHMREWWAIGFAYSEIVTGIMIGFGIFVRPLVMITAALCFKMILVDFGWEEFPHFFMIAILILIGTSTKQKQLAAIDKNLV